MQDSNSTTNNSTSTPATYKQATAKELCISLNVDDLLKMQNIMTTGLCSGYGQYHSPNNKAQPQDYISITFQSIESIVKHPPSVDKAQAQWFIPSTLMSRVHSEQQNNGKFYALWCDLDQMANISFFDVHQFLKAMLPPETRIICYTTKSATEDNQKCRSIIPLAEPVNGLTFTILQTILNDRLEKAGIPPDRATQRTGQVCSLPNKGQIYDSNITGTKLFNHAEWEVEIEAQQEILRLEALEHTARQQRAMQQVRVWRESGQLNPVEAYKEYYPVETALESYGYIRHGNKWLSPNSESGNAGVSVKNGKWYSHHSSDSAIGQKGFNGSGGTWGDAFDLFVYYECGGDYNNAVKKAGEMFTVHGKTINQHNYWQNNSNLNNNPVDTDTFNHTDFNESVLQVEKKNSPPITFCSFGDIYQKKPLPEWVIKDFIPKGESTLISATGGIGKSMFSLYLAHLLATESEIHQPDYDGNLNIDYNQYLLFEEFPILKSGISSLFLQTENSDAQLYFRMNKIAGDNIEPLNRIFAPMTNGSALASGQTFIQEIKRQSSSKIFEDWFYTLVNTIQDQTNQKIELVWLDPLISFCSCSENDNAEMRRNLDVLTSIAQKCQITPIVIHHNAKDRKEYRGASSIFDWTRNLISLNRVCIPEPFFIDGKMKTREVPAIEVTHEKCNVGRMFTKFKIRMDDNFRFSRIADEAIDPDTMKEIDSVIRALKDLGGYAQSQNQLAKKYEALTGQTARTGRKYVTKAVEYNFIKCENDGKDSYCYTLINN